MRKNYILATMFSLVFSVSLIAQTYVKQVIIGNGGIYGNPDDHVTVASYNPDDQTTTAFGDILRESIQDLIIHNNYVYVTAEDSICKFDIDSYQKVVSVFESNLHRLFYHEGFLFVSRRSDINGAPADGIYLKIYNAENLTLVAAIEGISSDASGIIVAQDTAYVAVSGDWQATEGKFAVIDLGTYNLEREMNFGTEAVGIYDLFTDGEKIFTINKSPYGATTGSITTYNVGSASFSTNVINHVVGKGVSLEGNILYLGLDYGIGSYDVVSNQVLQNTIVPDPGSATYTYIADAAFDNINQLFYVTITDYFSMGEGKIFDMAGNETGTFEADVSAEAIDIDYDYNSSITKTEQNLNVSVWPNPVENYLNIQSEDIIEKISIFNHSGQQVFNKEKSIRFEKFNLEFLEPGLYIVQIQIGNRIQLSKIIKR